MSMCRVFSCVVGRGCLLWPVHSLGKTLLGFALLHSVFQGQICPLLHTSIKKKKYWGEKKNTGENLGDLEGFLVTLSLVMSFLIQHNKSRIDERKKKISKLMSLKWQLSLWKTGLRDWKQATDWEKISTNHLSDKRPASKISKQLLKLNNKTDHTMKNGQNIRTHPSPSHMDGKQA